MGISAHYYAYLQDDIEKIKNGGGGELLDEYDLNNFWDAMCKMLTGRNFKQRLKTGDIFSSNEPFSWAIFGRSALNEELSEMISYTKATDVKEVAETLKNVDISALLAKINLKEFAYLNFIQRQKPLEMDYFKMPASLNAASAAG